MPPTSPSPHPPTSSSPHPPTHSPSDDDLDALLLAQMKDDFLSEFGEILERLGPLVIELEQTGSAEVIQAIFREVHTLKGNAGFVNLTAVQKLAHKTEDLFDIIRNGNLAVTPEVIDVVFESLRLLDAMHQDLAAGGSGEMDIAAVSTRLETVRHQETLEKAAAEDPDQTAAAPRVQGQNSLRVELRLLDRLITLVGELITARNALQANAERLKDPALSAAATTIDRLTTQIQGAVTQVRLTPIERLFNRFIPVVRNMTRKRETQVQLIIAGGETPLDSTIFEQMYDPLIHLIRNALDHGLETPAERVQQGKPGQGSLRLSAEQRGDDVLIRVSDDGRGIDPQTLRDLVVARQLMSAEAAAALSDEQAIRQVFTPGLSTAEKVTEISGRGVGLDVVVQNVRRLRGSVDIETALGQGTTFIIRLPLTMAILNVMLVRSAAHTYVFPLQVIRETLQLSAKDLHTMQGDQVVYLRETPLPVRSLASWLHPNGRGNLIFKTLKPAIVVHLTRGPEVLVVDELVGRQQVVIQPLNPALGQMRGVDGTAILPDGSVTLILDVEGLAENG